MSFLALVLLAYHNAYALARIQDNIPLYTTILIIYIKTAFYFFTRSLLESKTKHEGGRYHIYGL